MASFGGITFLTVRAPVLESATELSEIERDGADGIAFHDVGKRGTEFDVQLMRDASNAAAVKSLRTSIAALQGTLVDIVDDTGETYEDFMCLKINGGRERRVRSAVGGIAAAPDYVIEWTATCISPR